MRTSAILSGLILQNSVRRANNSDLDDLVSKADRSESSAPRVPNHLLVVIVLLVGHCLLPTEQLQEADRSSGPTLEGQSSNFTAYVADQKPSRAVTKSSTSGRRPSRPPGRKWTGEEFYSAPGGGDAPRAGREMLAAHFSDFDDFAALNLSSFYSLPSSAASSRRKFERKRSNGTNFYTAAVSSNNHRATSASRLALAAGGGDQCALALATGGCISFNMVEWAARLARRALRFEQPEDLNSLEPDEPTINAVGELNELTTRLLAARFGLTAGQVAFELDQIDVSRTSLWRSCPRIYRQPLARPCRADFSPSGSGPLQQVTGRYRTLTGACNNPLAPQLGSALMPFVRLLPPDYADGVGLPRGLLQGHLPPARLVSLELHPDLKSASSDLSVLFAMWGQLINHDLAMASGARVATGHDGQCCSMASPAAASLPGLSPNPNRRVCFPIQIGPYDPVYGPLNINCLDFKRSLAGLRPGCSLGPRTQLNLITSYVDASFVYGSTQSQGRALRNSRRAGQLALWSYFPARLNLKPLLPPQLEAPDEECAGRPEGLFCFRSGDARTNQQVPLVVLHTVHARQHNRLAQGLQLINPHWSSGRLYQEARHIHIALVQHFLLTEYLPLLLGPKLCAKYNLTESDHYWDHYDASINAGVSQEFAAAAFRQGHSSVPSEVLRVNHFRQLVRLYPLRQLFRRPWPLFEPGAMDEFLLGLTEGAAQTNDPFVSQELSGHLLQNPGERVGLDLISINIQRGRDQGVASYNSFREWCGFGRFEHLDQLSSVMSNSSGQLMGQLYGSVDAIDLFTGALSEWPLEGAQVGPTLGCIIGRQFEALRAGDRLWFESSLGPHAFSPSQLASIKQVPLARLICANSDRIDAIQPQAMRLPHPVFNPLVPCEALPEVDLSLWMEPQVAAALGGEGEREGDEEESDDGFR